MVLFVAMQVVWPLKGFYTGYKTLQLNCITTGMR